MHLSDIIGISTDKMSNPNSYYFLIFFEISVVGWTFGEMPKFTIKDPKLKNRMKNPSLANRTTYDEEEAWLSFKEVIVILKTQFKLWFTRCWCIMNVNIHLLNSHLDDFPEESGWCMWRTVTNIPPGHQGNEE